nr:PQQ-binding-like beta-propeller repeat protein [Halomarina salina]
MLAGTATVASSALAGCAALGSDDPVETYRSSPDWRFARHDTYNSGHAPVELGSPDERWRLSLDGAVRTVTLVGPDGFVGTSASAEDGRSWVGNVGLGDGTRSWTRPADGRPLGTAYTHDTLYVATRSDAASGVATAYVPEDGELRWHEDLRAASGAPVVGGGLAYFPTDTGLRAWSSGEGTERWRLASSAATFAPALTTDGLFVAAADGPLGAFDADVVDELLSDADAPTRRWRSDVAAVTPPVTTDERVLVGTAADELRGFSHEGDPVWTESLPGRPAPPVDADGTAVVATTASDGVAIRALDVGSGDRRWERSLDGSLAAPPVATDDAVVLPVTGGENGERHSIRALAVTDGSSLWERPLPSPASAIAVSDDALVVGTERHLLAFGSE